MMTDFAEFVLDLTRLSAFWLSPEEPFRKQTALALSVSTGRRLEAVEAALQNAFGDLTPETVATYIKDEEFQEGTVAGKALIVAPGSVFTAWIPSAITAWLLGYDVLLKSSQQEPVFAKAFASSLRKVAPRLAARFKPVAWSDALVKFAQAVVVYGSDETIAFFRKEVAAEVPFVGYGHKVSAAIIYEEILKDPVQMAKTGEGLDRDLLPFDLDGCLSPHLVLVQSDNPADMEIFQSSQGVRPEYCLFNDAASLLTELRELSPHLSTIGVAGNAEHYTDLMPLTSALGASRLCRIGTMQRPPLSWTNGARLSYELRPAPKVAKIDGNA